MDNSGVKLPCSDFCYLFFLNLNTQKEKHKFQIYESSASLFERIQKAKENTRRGIFRIASWRWWWRHFIDESHDSRNGRLKKERTTKQDTKKKNTLCRSSTLIRFSCKVPFIYVYARFLLPQPHFFCFLLPVSCLYGSESSYRLRTNRKAIGRLPWWYSRRRLRALYY